MQMNASDDSDASSFVDDEETSSFDDDEKSEDSASFVDDAETSTSFDDDEESEDSVSFVNVVEGEDSEASLAEHEVEEELKCVVCWSKLPDRIRPAEEEHRFCRGCLRSMEKYAEKLRTPVSIAVDGGHGGCDMVDEPLRHYERLLKAKDKEIFQLNVAVADLNAENAELRRQLESVISKNNTNYSLRRRSR